MLKFNLGLWFFKHMVNLIFGSKTNIFKFKITTTSTKIFHGHRIKGVCTSYTPFSNAGDTHNRKWTL